MIFPYGISERISSYQVAVKLYGKCVYNAGQAIRVTRNFIGQRVQNLGTNQIEDTSKTVPIYLKTGPR